MQKSKGRRQQLGPNRPHTIKSGEIEKWPIGKDGLAANKKTIILEKSIRYGNI